MRDNAVTYLSRAIQRIEPGAVESGSGSHIAGIFGKTANPFEKAVRSYVLKLIESCGLNYERDIRPRMKGPAIGKLTLGICVAAMREASYLKPICVASNVPAGTTVDNFLRTVGKINDAWVHLKHGDEVGHSVLVEQMKSMLAIYHTFKFGAAKSLSK
jgi:hypothetical protein